MKSTVGVEATAVFVRKAWLATVGAVTVIVTVAVNAVAGTVPSEAVTTPPACVQEPAVLLTQLTNVTPAGKVSVSVTADALVPPKLLTEIV